MDNASVPAGRSLVLLPGLDGEGFSFRKLLEHLQPSLRPTVITYARDRAMGYDQLLPLVASQLPESPFVLLGDSFSSPLAIMLAAQRPAGLLGLVLTSGFARNPLWLSPMWLAYAARPPVSNLYKPYVRAKVWWRGGGPVGAQRLAALEGLRSTVMAERFRSVLRVNVLDQLARCPVPVLYVRGRRDRLVNSRNLSEMRACLPTMRVAEFDAGHCVLRSKAPPAAAAIVEFTLGCHAEACEPIAAA